MEFKNLILVTFVLLWEVLVAVETEDPLQQLIDSENDSEENASRVKKQIPFEGDRWTDARYAAKFAVMLNALEDQNRDVFTRFISSGFTEKEIPRALPAAMMVLSRVQPSFRTPAFGQDRRPQVLRAPSVSRPSSVGRIGRRSRPVVFPNERARLASFPPVNRFRR